MPKRGADESSVEERSERPPKGHVEDTNYLVITGPKRKKPKTDAAKKRVPGKMAKKAQEQQQAKKQKLSSAQKKRLQKLQEKKAKKAQREQLLQSLAQHALTAEQLKLFHSSSTIGRKETTKERLTRAFHEKKTLGFSLADDSRLEVPTQAANENMDEEEEEEENGEGIKAEIKTEEKTKPHQQQQQANNGSNAESQKKKKKKKKNKTKKKQTQDHSSTGTAQPSTSEAANPKEQPQPNNASSTSSTPQKKITTSANGTPHQKEATVIPEKMDMEIKTTNSESPSSSAPSKQTTATTTTESTIVRNVLVNRDPEIEKQRQQLPIYMEEQRIMECIMENDAVVICGETGSGKTTQVPQFLHEAAFGHPQGSHSGMIGITQPRRVAAISMATRVAAELNTPLGDVVAYQVRYDTSVSPKTRIKFMTDGILLKEIQGDFLLRKYSAIIIDEAHERNLNTDILVGLLSRIIPLRAQLYREQQQQQQKQQQPEAKTSSEGTDSTPLTPLKLIIMSATLRVSDFVENYRLFPSKPPPVLSVDARQFPVSIHYNRRTPLGEGAYIEEAFRKVSKIHKKLPPGGVLVFLTGQQEIETLCRRLRKAFAFASSSALIKRGKKGKEKQEAEDGKKKDKKTEEEKNDGDEEEEEDKEEEEEDQIAPMHVLPLYSVLPTQQQLRVFEPPPEGARLVVVATNVAETSITIPGITYVVDCGKVKEKYYNKASGISAFQIDWCSKASADQRAGRAGRTGPGHCYRLFSSAVFNDYFPSFSEPEILRIPIEGIVLQMKCMSIDKIPSFPFPTPPDSQALAEAEKTLSYIGALEKNGAVTPLGRTLSMFPLAPRWAKMLVLGRQEKCLPYVVAIVSILSVRDPFLRQGLMEEEEAKQDEEEQLAMDDENNGEKPKTKKNTTEGTEKRTNQQEEARKEEEKRRRRAVVAKAHATWAHPQSDLLAALRALGAFEYAGATPEFCQKYMLDGKAMKEILQMRQQLMHIMTTAMQEASLDQDDLLLKPPTPAQELMLRQVIAGGLVDQVARLDAQRNDSGFSADGGRSLVRQWAYRTCRTNETVFIHPTSFLFSDANLPEYVVYRELVHTSKTFMKGVTAIQPAWLPLLGTALCSLSKPLEMPAPRWDVVGDAVKCFVTPSYGPFGWTLPPQELEMEEGPMRYKYFMRFLLEGLVFPSLLKLREHLTGRPSLVTSDTWNQHKMLVMVQALMKNGVASRRQFLAKWREQQKTFLLKEMRLWVQPSAHALLQSLWSALDQ